MGSSWVEAALEQFLQMFTEQLSTLTEGTKGIDNWQVATRQLAQYSGKSEAPRTKTRQTYGRNFGRSA